MHVFVEGNYHHPVTRPQLVNERNCGVLYLIYSELGRGADVDHQHDRKRLFDRLEILDLLLDSILIDLKVLLSQARNEPAVAVEHRNGHRHQIGLDLYDAVIIVLFGRGRRRSYCALATAAEQHRRAVLLGLCGRGLVRDRGRRRRGCDPRPYGRV